MPAEAKLDAVPDLLIQRLDHQWQELTALTHVLLALGLGVGYEVEEEPR